MKNHPLWGFLLALLFPLGLRAHQPDLSSTILAEKAENEWVLQVRSALTAFEYQIELAYGVNAYDSPEAFQALVAEYVADQLLIRFNREKPIVLQHAVVKLGHETTVTFQLREVPEQIKALVVQNRSFKDVAHNQSALLVLRQGFDKQQFTLSNSNGHQATLRVTDTKFALVAREGKDSSLVLWLFFATSLAIILLVLFDGKTRHFRRPGAYQN